MTHRHFPDPLNPSLIGSAQHATALEAFCRAIAPVDLKTQRIPIVLESQLVHHNFSNTWIIAAMLPRGTVSRDEDTVLIRDDYIRRSLQEDNVPPEKLAPAIIRDILHAVLHELCHVLELLRYPDDDPPQEICGWEGVVQRLDATVNIPSSGPAATIPWRGHGSTFIRILCHVAFRTGQSGITCDPDSLIDARAHGLSLMWKNYFRTLRAECHRMRDESFSTILSTPAPRDFIRAWKEDTAAWLRAELRRQRRELRETLEEAAKRKSAGSVESTATP